jgi:hypothetical protein
LYFFCYYLQPVGDLGYGETDKERGSNKPGYQFSGYFTGHLVKKDVITAAIFIVMMI